MWNKKARSRLVGIGRAIRCTPLTVQYSTCSFHSVLAPVSHFLLSRHRAETSDQPPPTSLHLPPPPGTTTPPYPSLRVRVLPTTSGRKRADRPTRQWRNGLLVEQAPTTSNMDRGPGFQGQARVARLRRNGKWGWVVGFPRGGVLLLPLGSSLVSGSCFSRWIQDAGLIVMASPVF